MQLELVDLRLFLQIAEAGSITQGARRAHLALAAASTRIRNLDFLVGVPLLLRERRRVHLTPAGHILAYYARGVFQQIERLRDEFGEYTSGLRGHVRLFSNPGFPFAPPGNIRSRVGILDSPDAHRRVHE
jgi:DNA-binding transcriptional LysR family regulator